MNRATAVRAVWDLLNKNDFQAADKLMREQRHGNRMFSYWMRLDILNGLWLQETGQSSPRP